MSSVSTAFKVHYNQKLGEPFGHLGGRTMAFGGDRRPCLHIASDVMELCTKFERNRAIHSGVIAISIKDLMTLNAM